MFCYTLSSIQEFSLGLLTEDVDELFGVSSRLVRLLLCRIGDGVSNMCEAFAGPNERFFRD